MQVRLQTATFSSTKATAPALGSFCLTATIYSVVTCQLLTVANFPSQLGESAYQHELHRKTEGFVTSILTLPGEFKQFQFEFPQSQFAYSQVTMCPTPPQLLLTFGLG